MTAESNVQLESKITYNGFAISSEKVNEMYSSLKSGEEKSIPNEKLIGEDKYLFMLKFRKGDNGIVYLNGFTAIDKANENRQQYFAIGKDKLNITSKEAYNLMEGRAVFKNLMKDENTKNPVWLTLDFDWKNENGNFKFKTFNKSYGFFPEKQIAKMGIDLQYKKSIMKSLKKGNEVKGTIEVKGENKTVSFFANPENKKVHFVLENGSDNKKDMNLSSNINQFTLNYLVNNPSKQESFINDLNQKDGGKLLKMANDRSGSIENKTENAWESNQLSAIAKICNSLIEKAKSNAKQTGQEV